MKFELPTVRTFGLKVIDIELIETEESPMNKLPGLVLEMVVVPGAAAPLIRIEEIPQSAKFVLATPAVATQELIEGSMIDCMLMETKVVALGLSSANVIVNEVEIVDPPWKPVMDKVPEVAAWAGAATPVTTSPRAKIMAPSALMENFFIQTV